MKIFKRILAVLFWLCAVVTIVNIFIIVYFYFTSNDINRMAPMIPMQFAVILLLYRWGKDLWFADPATIYMNNWVRSLIYIGYHIGLVLVCALLGITISIFFANGDSFVTNMIFFATILTVGLCIHPKMYIPKHILIPNSVTKIESYAFGRRNSIVTVTIGYNVTSVGENPFCCCRKLKAFYGKFTSLDNRCLIVNSALKAFAPAGLTEYSVPNSVASIGENAFHACYKLKRVILPDSVTEIGKYAFSGCTSLINTVIPDNVAYVGMGAFWGCSLLKEVYCKPTTPPIAYSYMFQGIALNGKIYVPRNSVDAYKSAEGWKDYAGIIVGYDF